MTKDETLAKLDSEAAKAFFLDARNMIADGAKEDALRYLLCSCLPLIFPSNPWWIKAHAQLAESNSAFRIDDHVRNGFVDVLIGRTAVEYEKNLNNAAIFNEGYHQVKEYCAGLLNEGADALDIIGVLSDTVQWYTYDISSVKEIGSDHHFGPDDIELRERDHLDMADLSDGNLIRFEKLINEVYGRRGSRPLSAKSLANDFGLCSSSGSAYLCQIEAIVNQATLDNPAYAQLIQNLWDGFVNGMHGSDIDSFKVDYVHELYIVTLAKLVCANVFLEGKDFQDMQMIESVLNGSYFVSLGIENFVEYDYFGWLNNEPYLADIAQIAFEMQESLSAYDFRTVNVEDLFGPLLSQLATMDKRLLLGQAPTPSWLASEIVDCVLEQLNDNEPRLLDMCCGSGVFIVETLKRFTRTIDDAPNRKERVDLAYGSITGMDIDPLAVILSKANWLLIMKEYIGDLEAPVHIPIYHADSMFASTPVAKTMDQLKGDSFSLLLDDRSIRIPSFLFDPKYRTRLNKLMDVCDSVAMTLAESDGQYDEDISRKQIEQCFSQDIELTQSEEDLAVEAITNLGNSLIYLQRSGRNGIWPFILGNSFMPALMKGSFSGIVSNPPWLALSRLGNNPYKESLSTTAALLGIKPEGSSFLHTELATVFFVGSINRYVRDDGVAACIMPQSILNGRHEENFRRQGYLDARNSTEIEVEEIWELPKETFKNRAAVLFARKRTPSTPSTGSPIAGRYYQSENEYDTVQYSLLTNGSATAFSYNQTNLEDAYTKLPFEQGFDAFPRTAVFFESARQPNGFWSLSSIPLQGSDLSYLVSDAKKAKTFVINPMMNVDPSLMFKTIISKQVMPFLTVDPVMIFLPLKYMNGEVKLLSDIDRASLNSPTNQMIDTVLECSDNGERVYSDYFDYLEKINFRSKLSKGLSSKKLWQVVYGASGENLAATVIGLSHDSVHVFAADQTLYWLGCDSEAEAMFYCGLLNSNALNMAIKEFQPEGNFGKRHIHTLPLNFIPSYDDTNEQHLAVSELTKKMFQRIEESIELDAELHQLTIPSNGTLASRRTKYKNKISEYKEYEELEQACTVVI